MFWECLGLAFSPVKSQNQIGRDTILVSILVNETSFFFSQGQTPLEVALVKRGSWIAKKIREARQERGLESQGNFLSNFSGDKVHSFWSGTKDSITKLIHIYFYSHLMLKPFDVFLILLQMIRKRVMLFFPFFALFAIGFVFNLSQPWFVKIVLFVALGLIWKLLGK